MIPVPKFQQQQNITLGLGSALFDDLPEGLLSLATAEPSNSISRQFAFLRAARMYVWFPQLSS